MIKNYFKVAWRTLVQNKLYTTLNIAGLTFGITCFLLIGLYLFDELTFDQQHSKTDRIYRVIEHKNTKGEELTIAGASYKLAEESKKSIPEIESTTKFQRMGRDNVSNPENKNKFNETISYSDENLLKIFDFNLLSGDRNTALKEPNSIVITEELALRLFGNTEVTGKALKIDFLESPLKVTAVIKNHPKNSSFDFSLMISENTFKTDESYKEITASDWSSNSFSVYILLKEKTKAETVAPEITKLIKTNYTPEAGITMAYSLQPLKDIHLYSESIADGARNSNVAATGQGKLLYLKIFAVVALFVLVIACINYMNLTTARASKRSKEIGVRKSVGALGKHLVFQFLFESLIVAFISFVLSVIAVNLLLPAFNQFTNKQLSLWLSADYRIWLYTIAATIIIGLLSGSYPSLLLSRFKPVALLKGMKINDRTGLSFRKVLVIFQFTVSVVMIIATIVLFQQVRYVNSKDLGFNKEQLVVVDINSGAVRRGAETIKTEFSKIPGVKNVSTTSRVPGEWKTLPTVKIKSGTDGEDYKISYLIGADENFAKTFEVKLLNGRNFLNDNDTSSVILNETAAKLLGIKQASNQLVDIPTMAFGGSYFPVNETNESFKASVIGIVKDFNFQSLREKIAPLVLAYEKNPVHNIDYYTARIDGRDATATLKKMEAVLAKIDANHLFEYHFLDDQLALFYAEDKRRETLLTWAALATVFIACLGLFGLATYTAEQRVKEIGIRKVLGAGMMHLASMLSKDFLKLVLIANGIAFPIAWWATDNWLREFAYHIDVKWWVFGLAGTSAIIIALLTISFQAIRAALTNPVNSLRTE
ncbi:MAG: ABC transporter permease [Bacteroidota bacterium]